MSAGEDEETCLVYQLAGDRELAMQGRQQREEHQRRFPSDQMTTQDPQARLQVAERGERPVAERQVMSPNSAGVGSSE
eukprot:1928705-Prorocentrum_lima.AAC.1